MNEAYIFDAVRALRGREKHGSLHNIAPIYLPTTVFKPCATGMDLLLLT